MHQDPEIATNFYNSGTYSKLLDTIIYVGYDELTIRRIILPWRLNYFSIITGLYNCRATASYNENNGLVRQVFQQKAMETLLNFLLVHITHNLTLIYYHLYI